MTGLVILCVCVLFVGSNAGKAPFINRCKINDNACLLNSGRAALPFLAAGIPELGVPSADPIYLDFVNGDAEDLKLTFIHMNVVGARQCKMTKLESQGNSFHMELECPFTATGQYILGGKLGIIPAEGEGDFEIKTDNIRIIVNFVLIEVDGYWKIESFERNFEPIEKFYINLGNLFNGDKKRAEPILKILDNGWRDLITEIGKPIILEIIDKVVEGISKFFDSVPINELKLE